MACEYYRSEFYEFKSKTQRHGMNPVRPDIRTRFVCHHPKADRWIPGNMPITIDGPLNCGGDRSHCPFHDSQ